MKQSDVLKLEDGRHRVSKGLYLEVRNEGRHRSWLFVYRRNNVRSAIGLGSAKDVTLQGAKDQAVQLQAVLAKGLDPKGEIDKAREKTVIEKNANARTFAIVARQVIGILDEVKRWKDPKYKFRLERVVIVYANPYIGNKPISTVTYADVLNLLKKIWTTKNSSARRLRFILEAIFAYAIRQGWYSGRNPVTWQDNLEYDLPKSRSFHTIVHRPALTVPELQDMVFEFMKKPSTVRFATVFGALTATRSQEFICADWSEIDLEAKVWSIPSIRRKDGKSESFRVPLSSAAIYLLNQLPSKHGPIFPGQDLTRHMYRGAPQSLLKRYFKDKRAISMHGCRSTFRDWCAETGKDFILSEKSLMHSTGNTVVLSYQRSDLLEQRRALMEEWGETVLPLAKRQILEEMKEKES